MGVFPLLGKVWGKIEMVLIISLKLYLNSKTLNFSDNRDALPVGLAVLGCPDN